MKSLTKENGKLKKIAVADDEKEEYWYGYWKVYDGSGDGDYYYW